MKIYDRRVPIHETGEDLPPMDDLIEQLDCMLTQYSVAHAFTYVTEEERASKEKESSKYLLYWLHYDSEQNTEVTLIVSLFARMYLKKDSAKILAAISQSIAEEAA